MTDPARLEPLLASLPPGLRAHCERTAAWARELAQRFGAGGGEAAFVGLAHDIARPLSGAELLARAEEFHIPVGEEQRRTPLLLHGPVAAARLRRELGVEDPDVLDAVAWHMTGRAGMGLLEKVLFFADKTEPGREGNGAERRRAMVLIREDLDRALLALLDSLLAYYQRRSLRVQADMQAAREWLAGVVASRASRR